MPNRDGRSARWVSGVDPSGYRSSATLTLDDAVLSGGAQIKVAGSGLPRRITVADPIVFNNNASITTWSMNNNNNLSTCCWDSLNDYYVWINGGGTVGGVAHALYCFDVRTGNRVISINVTASFPGNLVGCFESPDDLANIWIAAYSGTTWEFACFRKSDGAYLGKTTGLAAPSGTFPQYIFARPGDAAYVYGRSTSGLLWRMTAPVVNVLPTVNTWADGSAFVFWYSDLTGKLLLTRNTGWREIDGTGATVYDFATASGIQNSSMTYVANGLSQMYTVPGTDLVGMLTANPPNARHWHLYDVAGRTHQGWDWESHNYTAFVPYEQIGTTTPSPGCHSINRTGEYKLGVATRGSNNFPTNVLAWRLGVQRARWSYTATVDTNLRRLFVNGAGVTTTSKTASGNATWPDDSPIYWYHSIDGGGRTKFDPNDPSLDVEILTGETIAIDADFRSPRGRRPGNYYIGGPLGEGIELLFA